MTSNRLSPARTPPERVVLRGRGGREGGGGERGGVVRYVCVGKRKGSHQYSQTHTPPNQY